VSLYLRRSGASDLDTWGTLCTELRC
jgi:hypothetical protein